MACKVNINALASRSTVERVGLLLLWLLLSWTTVSQSEASDEPLSSNFVPQCPDSCNCSGRTVVCRGTESVVTLNLRAIGLSEVPTFEGVYESLLTLDLSHNSISALASGTFTTIHFPSLEKVCLNDNEIATVEKNTFQLPSMVELNLSGNELRAINFILSLKLSLIHLSRNPLICEKLAVLLPLICDEELLVVDDATCTVHEKTNTTSSNNIIAIPLTDYCSNGEGVNIPLIVGSAFGGLIVLVVVLLTIITPIIISTLCRKNAKQPVKEEANRENHAHLPPVSSPQYAVTPSNPYAPPTVPPIPPPIDVPSATNYEEIYAAVCESPLTDTSIDSADYNNGYIVKLDSVPKSTAVFDAFASKMAISATPPGEYDIASPGIAAHQLGSQVGSPISPYRIFIPKTSNETMAVSNSSAPLSPLSIQLRKPLPPVMPKKWRQKRKEEVTERDTKIGGNDLTGNAFSAPMKRSPSGSYDTIISLEEGKKGLTVGGREEVKYLEVL